MTGQAKHAAKKVNWVQRVSKVAKKVRPILACCTLAKPYSHQHGKTS